MASKQELLRQRQRQQQLNDALVEATKQGLLADIQSLLARHADLDARDRNNDTPLHHASKYGHHQCVEILLDHGADISARDNSQFTSLHLASLRGHRQCIEILLDRGADKSLINVRLSLSAYASISLS